jgi:hypothetical protein
MTMASARRGLALGLAAALCVGSLHAPALEAQAAGAGRPRHPWMRPAKWLALGTAAGLAGYALTRTSSADDAYAALRGSCTRAPAGCVVDGGRYADAAAEALYQQALRDDRRAQLAIIGGQTVLLAAAALFVLDLRDGGPADIPYPSPARSCAVARCFPIGRLAF